MILRRYIRTPAFSDLEVSIAGVAIDRVKEARF